MKKLILIILITWISILSVNAADDLFKANRQKLLDQITDGIILIPSASNLSGWGSDKNFLYLTGFNIPGVILALNANGDKKEVLFIQDKAKEELPTDCSLMTQPISNLNDFLKNGKKLYLSVGRLYELYNILGEVNIFRNIDQIANISPAIYQLRLIKSAGEIEKIEKAIHFTAQALGETFKQCRAGNREVDLYAQIEYQALRNNLKTSFSQTASGPNSTHVHFGHTDRVLKPGETIVFDLGIYYQNYTSDISRTFPVNGSFTKEQKKIYTIVLNAQKAGINMMKPGSNIDETEKKVRDELVKGLFALGLMTDIHSKWQADFYIQHGFSHGIGLDVHDVLSYHKNLPDRKYETGMVFTMEPGLYFPEEMIKSIPQRLKDKVTEDEFKVFGQKVGSKYKKYINIGIRIEDDILITENGNRNLSLAIPKEIKDIEKIIR